MSDVLHIPQSVVDGCRSESMPFFSIGYYAYTLEGRVLFMDATAFGLLGLYKKIESPDAAVGRILDDLTGESLHADLRAQLKQHHIVRGYEWLLDMESGEDRWLYEDARLITPRGEMLKYVQEPYAESVVRDISMRKHKESIVYADQHKYQRIIEAIHEGYYEMGLAGHLTFFNRTLANILGMPEQDLIGRNPAELFETDAIAVEMKKLYASLRDGKISDGLLNWKLKRKDGTTAFLEVSVSLMFDKEGRRCGFRGLVRDVTERANAEEAFRVAETRYKNLFSKYSF